MSVTQWRLQRQHPCPGADSDSGPSTHILRQRVSFLLYMMFMSRSYQQLYPHPWASLSPAYGRACFGFNCGLVYSGVLNCNVARFCCQRFTLRRTSLWISVTGWSLVTDKLSKKIRTFRIFCIFCVKLPVRFLNARKETWRWVNRAASVLNRLYTLFPYLAAIVRNISCGITLDCA